MKAQTAFEYMVIVLLVMAFITPVWYHLNSVQQSTADQFIYTYAKAALNKLKDNADLVYSQRYDARVTIKIYIPPGVQNISISGNDLRMTVYTSDGVQDVFETTTSTVSGSLPTSEGLYTVLLEAKGDYVEISRLV